MRRRNAALPVPDFSRWTQGGTGFRRERALARRDGLWTSAGALRTAMRVPLDQNAATVLLEAVGGSGQAPPTPREGMLMGELGLAVWHRASERPRLVFERTWEKPHETLRPELASFKKVGKELVGLARAGHDPRGNLLAAARIAALVAQEPELVSQLVSLRIGRTAFQAAVELGIASDVEACLGEPSLHHGLRTMALGLPTPIQPRWRYLPKSTGWVAVPPWTRRMAPLAAERFQAQTLRACRRLHRTLLRTDEAKAFRRALSGFRRERGMVFFIPFDRSRIAQVAETFASYRALRDAVHEG